MVTSEMRSPPAAGSSTNGDKLSEKIHHLRTEVSPHLADLWGNALEAASAQFSIWGMKAGRAVTAAAIGMMLGIAALALLVYGFVLLDSCIAYALENPERPWLSPLIRGAVYFGLPALGLIMAWHKGVGYGTAEKEQAQRKEDQKSMNRMEGARV
ncbi:MAG TPA: phage holin family protein [Planctomycetota bacterium]|nr:phage holin family protein [Planctomycetota bacterium]